jgi:uncharacterized protein YbcI
LAGVRKSLALVVVRGSLPIVKAGSFVDQQEQLKHVSSYTSKLLRKKFGRGPESCHASFGHHFFVLLIRGFISPMEEVLLEQGQRDTVEHSRSLIVDSILPELKGVLEITFRFEIKEFYNDWNFPNNTGVIIGVILNESLEFAKKSDNSAFQERAPFEEEVNRVSRIVEKVPDRLETFLITSKMILVMRTGILIKIEKALVEKGYERILSVTKNELEKRYYHNNGRFNDILSRAVTDIFIDWNFKLDKSLMCFVLK